MYKIKLLMLFADTFEDTEAIATLDVLLRGKIEVTCASLMNSKEVLMKSGNRIIVDTLVSDINKEEYQGIVIPGGPASFKIMPNLKIVEELIRYYADNNLLVASICAAPHLVGKLGYFKDRNYTVHPGFEDYVIGGNYQRECGVVRSDNFITAKSMYYSIPFGLAIYEYFYGLEHRNELEKHCMGE